jgi:hypothetical protein
MRFLLGKEHARSIEVLQPIAFSLLPRGHSHQPNVDEKTRIGFADNRIYLK